MAVKKDPEVCSGRTAGASICPLQLIRSIAGWITNESNLLIWDRSELAGHITGREARGGAPARRRREQAAERDAAGGGGQVHGAEGPGQRHGGRRQPHWVLHIGGRLRGLAIQEADPERRRQQPRHRRPTPPQPQAIAAVDGQRSGPRSGGVHIGRRQRHRRRLPARRAGGVPAQGVPAIRPRRPR